MSYGFAARATGDGFSNSCVKGNLLQFPENRILALFGCCSRAEKYQNDENESYQNMPYESLPAVRTCIFNEPSSSSKLNDSNGTIVLLYHDFVGCWHNLTTRLVVTF